MSPCTGAVSATRQILPQGRALSEGQWRSRHRALLYLLLAHAPVLPGWALVNDHPALHGLHGSIALLALSLVAAVARSRAMAAGSVAFGLVLASALVVHLGGGHTFLHFHFFVIVAALALYQDWVPFLLALGFVVLEHGVIGVVAPHEVYSDAWSQAHPLAAAGVHGAYVLAAAAANVVSWGWSQRERMEADGRIQVEAGRVRDSERRLAELIDNAPTIVFVKDLQGRLLRVNPRFAEFYGKRADDLIGKTAGELFDRPELTGLLEADQEALRIGGVVETEHDVDFETGSRTMHIARFPLLDEAGEPYAVAGIGTDMTRRAAAEADLLHQSRHDSLTGLPNRTLLYERLDQALATDSLVGVLFLDLDGFKEVNDSFGHDAGDALLQAVAARLQGVCRDGEVLTRLGGDEFVVCLPHLVDVAAAEDTARRVLEALSEPVELPERVIEIRGSCGVAVGRGPDGATSMLLLRDADTALYEAKAAGRNRAVTFVPALRERDERRRRLQGDLAEALRDGTGLTLHYQPIFDAGSGRIVLAEALIRWQHPTDGMLPPAEFLGHAADCGLLPALDRWVVAKACAQAAEWQRAGFDVSVSVNVTPASVGDGSIVEWVRGACAQTGLAPTRLVIELTETAVVEHPAATSAALTQLRAMGVRVALDDFGTGFSSLSLLRDLPVDIVKIDRSFIAGTVRSGRDAAIVEATVQLAGALGATTIAEGVEEEAEMRAVIASGCEMVQGYFLSRPVEPDAVTLLLMGGMPAQRTAATAEGRRPVPV